MGSPPNRPYTLSNRLQRLSIRDLTLLKPPVAAHSYFLLSFVAQIMLVVENLSNYSQQVS